MKLIGWLIAFGLLFEGLMMLAVYISGEIPRQLMKSDALIVLGARVMPDGQLSTTLQHRVDKALSIYNEGYADCVITCGGQGGNEPVAEADAMAEYLIGQGVPQEAILRDDKSTDTVENIKNAKALMDERGLQSAIIVSSEYHVTRALWIARDAGFTQVTGAGSLGQNLKRNRVKANFRETLSWLNHWSGGLLGRLSGLRDDGGGES